MIPHHFYIGLRSKQYIVHGNYDLCDDEEIYFYNLIQEAQAKFKEEQIIADIVAQEKADKVYLLNRKILRFILTGIFGQTQISPTFNCAMIKIS